MGRRRTLEGRMFFFEKKNQKTFISCACPQVTQRGNKSLLLLFFRKEDSSLIMG
jgi:hypothetical protein